MAEVFAPTDVRYDLLEDPVLSDLQRAAETLNRKLLGALGVESAAQFRTSGYDETLDTSTESQQFNQQNTYYLGGIAVEHAGVKLASSEHEALTRARQRNQALMNSLRHSSETGFTAKFRKNNGLLSERLSRAAERDAEALASVRTDVLTELTEQICKAGGVLKVAAHINANGEVEQHGQTTYNRQKNTLENQSLGELKDNAVIEGQNGFLIEELHRQGALRGKRAVEFSLIPPAAHKALDAQGYYLREVIGIIRVTTIAPDGQCEIVSVLVGGTDQDKLPEYHQNTTRQDEIQAEQQALANRFDIRVVRRIYELLEVEGVDDMSTTDMLAEPILVSDKLDHLDITRLYDTVASEISGKPAMFFGLTNLRKGQYKPSRADYEAHEQGSLRSQQKLQKITEDSLHELIQRRNEAKTAMQATRLLREIAKSHAIRYLVRDRTADARVYGAEAFVHIEEGRQRLAMGDIYGAERAITEAKKVARATGCPSLAEKERLAQAGETDDTQSSTTESKSGKIRCIKCERKVEKSEVIKPDCWECPACGHKVDICTGAVLREGRVGPVRRAVNTTRKLFKSSRKDQATSKNTTN